MPLMPQKPEFYRDLFMDDMPKGRGRIKPDLIPGIAAYIILLADQYSEMEFALRQQRTDKNDKWEEGSLLYYQQMQQALAAVLKQLPSHFNRRLFDDVFNGVMEDFAVKDEAKLERNEDAPNMYPGTEG